MKYRRNQSDWNGNFVFSSIEDMFSRILIIEVYLYINKLIYTIMFIPKM